MRIEEFGGGYHRQLSYGLDGSLRFDIEYFDGIKHGFYIKRIPNGKIRIKCIHNMGKRVHRIAWYDHSIIASETNYDEHGELHGKCIDLYENGNVRKIRKYNHGELIEEKKYNESNGELL